MPQHQFLTVTILWRQMRQFPHRQMPKPEFDTSHQPKHLYFYPDFQLNRKSWTPLPRMTKKSNKLRPNHQGALCQSILKDNLAISGLCNKILAGDLTSFFKWGSIFFCLYFEFDKPFDEFFLSNNIKYLYLQ